MDDRGKPEVYDIPWASSVVAKIAADGIGIAFRVSCAG